MAKQRMELEQHMRAFAIVDDTYDLLKERIEEFRISKGWLECALDVQFTSQDGNVVRVFDDLFEDPLVDVITDVYYRYDHCGPTLDKWMVGE